MPPPCPRGTRLKLRGHLAFEARLAATVLFVSRCLSLSTRTPRATRWISQFMSSQYWTIENRSSLRSSSVSTLCSSGVPRCSGSETLRMYILACPWIAARLRRAPKAAWTSRSDARWCASRLLTVVFISWAVAPVSSIIDPAIQSSAERVLYARTSTGIVGFAVVVAVVPARASAAALLPASSSAVCS